jgi:transcription initiation factor IIE alpha subunit
MNLKEVKKEATVYQCPMKCEGDKTYGKEGKCPVCNMNLKAVKTKEKKKEDHSGHSH